MPLVDLYTSRHSKTLASIAHSARTEAARTLNASNPASLYCLPAELICEICDYLPTAETFCLMICCARFWHGRTGIPTFIKVRQLVCQPQPPRVKEIEVSTIMAKIKIPTTLETSHWIRALCDSLPYPPPVGV
ncbi:hypothetical protein UA08_00503 [Talaromyces atroroseus]|uniref:F-box domain-containing protein n=1 Tax=Talaromyces atroroseus TaxID=1441469 RepID=A0A225AYW2_TALAT|nr:hypothetical protein UA08_00503 [Talaromyces atroroseus]OKL63644.1 hypothetical protein UA08_00503 [Talaromyces atroroseus]